MIGGPQGSGINASAEVFAKACSRAGLRVYANIEYHSNIMGKHSFYRVRVDDEDMRSQFKGKRSEVGELNVRAAKLAFEHVKQHESAKDFPYTLKPGREPKARILAKGYEIHAIAKLKAGCAFQTYYPISPATDESVYLERQQRDHNLLVVQCEDEISSINMAGRAAPNGGGASTGTGG